MKQIESLKNPSIKQFKKWRDKSRDRKKDGMFLAEGLQECKMASAAGYTITHVLYCPNFIDFEKVKETVSPKKEMVYLSCSPEVFNDLAMRANSENIAIVAQQKKHDLNLMELGNSCSILVCDSIEKPGNLGAIARSAHAFGMDAILLSDALCDIYNPNTIRSSTGSIFSIPIFSASSVEIQNFLSKANVQVFTTHMHSSATDLRSINIPPKSAWVIGTEHSGLSEAWLSQGYQNVLIPMQGDVDSLNVSNAAAVIMYEILRQKV